MELDRKRELYEGSQVAYADFAFFDHEPPGRGVDAVFTPFNVFCLALGLELMDAGFKQRDVIFLLRHIRSELETLYETIRKFPPKVRDRKRYRRRSETSLRSGEGEADGDDRVFMITNKMALDGIFPVLDERLPRKLPRFEQPGFCRGINALGNELDKLGLERRRAFVLEIAYAAAPIAQFLEQASAVRRGRPS